MPGYDGTGPRGMGQMTGGGRGYCVVPVGGDVRRPAAGRFFGRGGGGRGWRNVYYATGLTAAQRSGVGAVDEKEALRREADLLREELTNIQARLDALDKTK